jgi:hypothetical protein
LNQFGDDDCGSAEGHRFKHLEPESCSKAAAHLQPPLYLSNRRRRNRQWLKMAGKVSSRWKHDHGDAGRMLRCDVTARSMLQCDVTARGVTCVCEGAA